MSESRPMMAFADPDGQVYEHPDLEMVGWDGQCWRPLDEDEVVPLPEGSDLFTLPGRRPVGLDRAADEVVILDEPGASAVSCFLAPAYLRILLPAYDTLEDAPSLPLFAFSAVGLLDGEFVTSAMRVDDDIRQDPFRFDIDEVEAGVEELNQAHPDNRLVDHLSHCALEYHCRAAQNYFLKRFEAPMPAAPTCNALCVGCISFQPEGGDEQPLAAHDRIGFAPDAKEMAEVALGHIGRVGAEAVVSFGQGCEGEPLMQSSNLGETISLIREETQQGVINLNSNASRPIHVADLFKRGLDSLRISTNSARKDVYEAYYRPVGYSFEHVKESSRVARRARGYVMLNYFVFPGVTDTREELDALSEWIEEVGIDMIQLRNLNIDPETYLDTLAEVTRLSSPMGLITWLHELRRRFPELAFGYFNPPRSRFGSKASLMVDHLP